MSIKSPVYVVASRSFARLLYVGELAEHPNENFTCGRLEVSNIRHFFLASWKSGILKSAVTICVEKGFRVRKWCGTLLENKSLVNTDRLSGDSNDEFATDKNALKTIFICPQDL